MDGNEKTIQNITDYINSLSFETEFYTNKKRRYYHNLSYYEIDYEVDRLINSIPKDAYMRYLDQKMKEVIKNNIIININKLYELIGFNKKFENLPTESDYQNISSFSKFLNMYDLGYPESEDNTFKDIIQELVNTLNYLHPHKKDIYKNELFSMYTLALTQEDFNKIVKVILDYKDESPNLSRFKNWAEIYYNMN